MCQNPGLANLEFLDLSTYLGDEGFYEIVARGPFRRLKRLHMVGVPLHAAGVRALARAPFAQELKVVRVDRRHQGGIEVLARTLPHVTIQQV